MLSTARSRFLIRLFAFSAACICLFWAFAAQAADAGWRIHIHDATVVGSAEVRLGEIARGEGRVPEEIWLQLADIVLMPAPDDLGRPMSISRARLQLVLRNALGRYEELCIYPANLAVQRGGAVLREPDLRQLVMRDLSGAFSALPGEVNLQDFRLPSFVFLSHPGQRVELEPTAITPGRNNLRFAVREGEGAPMRRFTGSVMVDVWAPVFCATRPLNRGETLEPASITTIRKNLAHLNGPLWDGTGGPWMMVRPVGTEQPIYQADITPLPLVRRGNIVTLRFESPSIVLSLKAEAMSDGGAGERIPVRNLDSRRVVHAVVLDGQTAVITR
jgi:flagella basal body P-ring formation protein FlgA